MRLLYNTISYRFFVTITSFYQNRNRILSHPAAFPLSTRMQTLYRAYIVLYLPHHHDACVLSIVRFHSVLSDRIQGGKYVLFTLMMTVIAWVAAVSVLVAIFPMLYTQPTQASNRKRAIQNTIQRTNRTMMERIIQQLYAFLPYTTLYDAVAFYDLNMPPPVDDESFPVVLIYFIGIAGTTRRKGISSISLRGFVFFFFFSIRSFWSQIVLNFVGIFCCARLLRTTIVCFARRPFRRQLLFKYCAF